MKAVAKKGFVLAFLCGLVGSCSRTSNEGITVKVHSVAQVVALFPKTVDEIFARAERAKKEVSALIDTIIAIPADQRTFENTARAFDHIYHLFTTEACAISMLEHVSPDEALREASRKASLQLEEFAIDIFSNNKKLYTSFKDYAEGNAEREKLTDVERYFLDETMRDFKRAGLALPENELAEVAALRKKLAAIGLQFSANIANGQRSIRATRDELRGLDDDFLQSLKHEGDTYILGTDFPTYARIMEQCEVEPTRKKMFKAYQQRAYPENMAVLDQLIALRDELAKKLGYESYAALDFDNQMAQSVPRVETFIRDMIARATTKEAQEFALLTTHLPAGVQLQNGKIKPWDFSFLISQYKKNNFDLDEQKVAEYFPMEKTVHGLLSIYEKFMNLTLKEVPAQGLWHPDTRMIEVYSNSPRTLRGYLLLDLHPRENKYNHAASFTILPSIKDGKGLQTPAVDVVVANFPKSTPTKPALLKHQDVETFFHEFGHAIHTILGGTTLASFSGTNVKTDFVEMPSQMLEEWVWDPQMLQGISSHYQTGEPLPLSLIEKKIKLRNLNSGSHILRQLFFARLSLDYFKDGAQKDTHLIEKKLHEEIRPSVAYEPETFLQASFGHLHGYGAKYYGYLWSKVFALDLFNEIKKQGLLDQTIGQRYVQGILGQGGSKDPNVLLENFLGRAPNSEAFFASMGL